MNLKKATKQELIEEIKRLRRENSGAAGGTGRTGADHSDQYRDLVENATEGVAVLQEGKLVFYNAYLKDFVGYSDDELKSKPFTDFIHPDDVEEVLDDYARRLHGEDR